MDTSTGQTYLASAIKRLKDCKGLGDKTFVQLSDQDFYFQPNEDSNSIAMIIAHLSGNMVSRWTNFLTEDGEKPWRNRDAEFDAQTAPREQLVSNWETGWACVFEALESLQDTDLSRTVHIRREPMSVVDAINRQLIHYASHVGQILYIGKMRLGGRWKSLSIPRGKSADFNRDMGYKH
jgi:hypothetical protein